MEFQKAIGVFAGFGNEILGMADTDIAVDRIQDTANGDRWIFLGG